MTSNGVSGAISALVRIIKFSPVSLVKLTTISISLVSVQCPLRPLQTLNFLTQFLHVVALLLLFIYKLTNILFTVLRDTRSLEMAPESNNTLALTCRDS